MSERNTSYFQSLLNKQIDKDIVEVIDNSYINHLFNVSFEIPQNWNFIHLEKFNELASKQTFKYSYEDLKEFMFSSEGSTFCVATKYDPDSDEHDGIISPTINFGIISKDLDNKDISLIDYALQVDINEQYSILKDFKILNKGEVFSQNGFDHISIDTEYLFEHPELDKGIMVELTILNIDFGDFFLDFSMTQCKYQGEIANEEFNTFIKSIGLNK